MRDKIAGVRRDITTRFPKGVSGNKKKPKPSNFIMDGGLRQTIIIKVLPDGSPPTTKDGKVLQSANVNRYAWLKSMYWEFMECGVAYDKNGNIHEVGGRLYKAQLQLIEAFEKAHDTDINHLIRFQTLDLLDTGDQTSILAHYIEKLKFEQKILEIAHLAVRFRLRGWQVTALLDNTKIVFAHGGRGAGRTVVMLTRCLLLCLIYPNTVGVVLRKAQEYNKFSTYLGITNLIESEPEVKELVKHHNKQSMVITFYNGSKLFFKGMMTDRDREGLKGIGGEGKTPGGQIDFIFYEEALAALRIDFSYMFSSLRGTAMGFVQLMMNSNPGPPKHWLHTDIIEGGLNKDKPESEHIEISLYAKNAEDNEWLMENNPSYVTNTLGGLTGIQRERHKEGKWKQAEGVVYDTWDEDKNVLPIITEEEKENNAIGITKAEIQNAIYTADKFDAIDWGETDPTCVLKSFTKTIDNQIHIFIYYELFQSGLQSHQIVEMLNPTDHQGVKIVPKVTICGHDKPGAISDLVAKGFNAVANVSYFSKATGYGVEGGRGFKADGRGIVHRFITEGRLHYIDGSLDTRLYSEKYNQQGFTSLSQATSSRPIGLREEVTEYCYTDKGELKTDTVQEYNDHAMDALLYLVLGVYHYYSLIENEREKIKALYG